MDVVNLSDDDIECVFDGPSSSPRRSRKSPAVEVASNKRFGAFSSPGSDSSVVVLDKTDSLIVPNEDQLHSERSQDTDVAAPQDEDEPWMHLFGNGTTGAATAKTDRDDSFASQSAVMNPCDIAILLEDEDAALVFPDSESSLSQNYTQPSVRRSKRKSSQSVVHSEENIVEDEKQRKKREKDALAAQKKEERALKAQERGARKLLKETEKLEKQAFKAARKPLQGGKSSLNSLTAFVSESIMETIGRDEIMEIIAEECDGFRLEEIHGGDGEDLVVRWSRSHITAAVESTEGSVMLKRTEEHLEERDILIQIPKKSFIAMVDFNVQSESGKSFDDSDRSSFGSFVSECKVRHPGKSLHFFVNGMDGYFRKQLNDNIYKNKKPPRQKAPRRSLLDIPYHITYEDVELAMIEVICRHNVRVVQIDSVKDFARLLITTHKSIAERVVKELKDISMESFDSISANIKTKGVTVSDDIAESYRELWIRQLEQFSLVSRDIAITVTNLYPSPRLLLAAYDGCRSEKEKEKLFENVMIKRGTDRRVGPKMSRLLYRFMNSLDGNEILE